MTAPGIHSTPMMRQYEAIKKQHRDKILFFQMGDFFEMFGEDAVIAAKSLSIQLTKRNKNDKNPLPFCGVPLHSCEQYLNKLIGLGYKVAVCEQIGDPQAGKGIATREVTRVVTPGTVLSQEALLPEAFSYVAAVMEDRSDGGTGVAFCDLTTGEFRFCRLQGKRSLRTDAGSPLPVLAQGNPAFSLRPTGRQSRLRFRRRVAIRRGEGNRSGDARSFPL